MAINKKSISFLIGLSLSSCGGGSGDSGSTPQPPPPTSQYSISIASNLHGSLVASNITDNIAETCAAGSVCTFNYNQNTQVVLTAQPLARYRFKQWTGDCSGMRTCIITPSTNQIISAEYELIADADLACIETSPAPAIPDISWQPVVSGLTSPVAIASAKGVSNRLFIAEQSGTIRTVTNGSLDAGVFLDISDRVLTSGGSTLANLIGLSSIAMHPQFASNGLFYVYYISERSTLNNIDNGQCTSSDACIIISEFNTNDISNGVPGNLAERILFDIPMNTATRSAGHIAFGLENEPYLYISLGDTGNPYNGSAQTTLPGSVLRINVNAQDASLEYAIPTDNPALLANSANNSFDISNGRDEIWAYGFRNPWRFSFDPLTGILYLGDDGEYFKELNIIDNSQFYGWSSCEGFSTVQSIDCGPFNGTGMPTADVYHTLPIVELYIGDWQSIVSGNVYRGSQYSNMCGAYVYADYISGKVSALRYSNSNGITEQKDLTPLSGIIAFGTDQDFEIYAVSRTDGALYHLTVP